MSPPDEAEFEKLLRRLDGTERNVSDQAKVITGLIDDHGKTRDVLDMLKTDREVRKVRDEHLNERLEAIETSIDKIYKLGWWVLGAFGLSLIASVTGFIINGGLHVK